MQNDFEWNDAKNRSNVKKHGIDFDDAIQVFDDEYIEKLDDRFHYGEDRYIVIGEVNGITLIVVYTMRNNVCRIISARKANRREQKNYYAASRRAPPG